MLRYPSRIPELASAMQEAARRRQLRENGHSLADVNYGILAASPEWIKYAESIPTIAGNPDVGQNDDGSLVFMVDFHTVGDAPLA